MIDKALEAKILRCHFVEQWGVNTIARQLGIHHTTVDRVLSQADLPKADRARRPSIVDPYHPLIIETLAHYPRLSAARLLAMARARGYTGGAIQFRAHVAQLRPRRALITPARPICRSTEALAVTLFPAYPAIRSFIGTTCSEDMPMCASTPQAKSGG